MCVSGTLLIEAALIAYNIPVNIFRKRFGFQGWQDFDPKLWNIIKETSLNKEVEYQGTITGGDNFQKAIRISRENIDHALEKYVFTDTLHTKVVKNINGDSSGVRGSAWLNSNIANSWN